MDRGIRPYASSAKTYNEMMDEETEQYYRSRNYNINPSLKQPYTFSSYTEMMYLYSGGEKKKEDNIDPVIIATVTSPDYEFFDYFVEPVDTTTYYLKEDCNNLDSWTITTSSANASIVASPSGYFTSTEYIAAGGTPEWTRIVASLSDIPNNFTFEIKITMNSGGVVDTPTQIRFNSGGAAASFAFYDTFFRETGNITVGSSSVNDLYSDGVENTFKFVVTRTDVDVATVEVFVNGVSQFTSTDAYVPDTKTSLYIDNQSYNVGGSSGLTTTQIINHIYIY